MAKFDLLGDVYENSTTELPFREYLENHSMRKAVGDPTGLRVLDLGCGTGVYTRRYAEWGAAKVLGIDVSDGMLSTARQTHTDQPLPVEYLSYDAANPPPGGHPALNGQFDLVASVYVLCYATTAEELRGFFDTTRRALDSDSGRMIAMTLNPDYGKGVEYYRGYGFTLTQTEQGEGAPVTLDATLPTGGKLHVTGNWWSRQAYEQAATAAGFTDISWTAPTVSDQGLAAFGQDYWDAYLTAPQALIMRASPSGASA